MQRDHDRKVHQEIVQVPEHRHDDEAPPRLVLAGRRRLELKYATALFLDRAASRVQLQESVKVLEEIEITSLRVLGASHFLSNQIKINLERARKKLARAEGISGSNLSR